MASRCARAILSIMRADITSPYFIVSTALVFFALLLSRDPYSSNGFVSNFTEPFQWGNAIELTTLAVGTCSSSNLAKDFNTGFAFHAMARLGRKRYYRSRFVSDSFASGAACFAGFTLYAVFAFLSNMGPDAFAISAERVTSFDHFLVQGLVPFWLAAFLLVQFLYGTLIGCIGVISTALTRNPAFCSVLPFLTLFFWRQACSILGFPDWANPMRLVRCLTPFDSSGEALIWHAGPLLAASAALFAVFVVVSSRKARSL